MTDEQDEGAVAPPPFASNVPISRPVQYPNQEYRQMNGFSMTANHGLVVQYQPIEPPPPKWEYSRTLTTGTNLPLDKNPEHNYVSPPYPDAVHSLDVCNTIPQTVAGFQHDDLTYYRAVTDTNTDLLEGRNLDILIVLAIDLPGDVPEGTQTSLSIWGGDYLSMLEGTVKFDPEGLLPPGTVWSIFRAITPPPLEDRIVVEALISSDWVDPEDVPTGLEAHIITNIACAHEDVDSSWGA